MLHYLKWKCSKMKKLYLIRYDSYPIKNCPRKNNPRAPKVTIPKILRTYCMWCNFSRVACLGSFSSRCFWTCSRSRFNEFFTSNWNSRRSPQRSWRNIWCHFVCKGRDPRIDWSDIIHDSKNSASQFDSNRSSSCIPLKGRICYKNASIMDWGK